MGVDLMTVGEAFEDLIFENLPHLPRPGQEIRTTAFARTIGGGAVITAIGAARLGLRVGIVSALAPDAARRLRREGVAVSNLRQSDEPHAVSVALSTRRDRAFATFAGVNRELERRVLARRSGLHRARHVHFALGPLAIGEWIDLVEQLRARGIGTSWDFGWHESLAGSRQFARLLGALDCVFVNEHEARLYAGAATVRASLTWWRQTTRLTIVKLGARGSRVVGMGVDLRAAAPRVRVVDTTGAGDAFNGGYLAAALRGRSLSERLRLGNLVGARSTRRAGGVDALPAPRELPRWVRRMIAPS